MGEYTECIIGCCVDLSPPDKQLLDFLLSDLEDVERPFPPDYPFPKDSRVHWMFNSGGSAYFGAISGDHSLRENIDKPGRCSYRFNARFNIKNYGGEIELFLSWLKPRVSYGSGADDTYAITIYEEGEPIVYSLRESIP